MTELKTALLQVQKAMKEQECYKNYQLCLKKIKKDEKLYRELNTFRKKNVELHANQYTLREEAHLAQEFKNLLFNESVKEFLHWEQKTLELIKMLHNVINNGLDMDYDFFVNPEPEENTNEDQ